MAQAPRKSFQLYFGKRDQDLWDRLQMVPEGDRNHFIRVALRNFFLGETNELPQELTEPERQTANEQTNKETVKENPIDKIGLIGGGMIR